MPPKRSTRERIVLVAERLFAEHGIDGVSLRQIAVESGSGNNSAVQYHFGSKEQLVEAIFQHRLPSLDSRRRLLFMAVRPDDLRSWVRCFLLPILEQGEEPDSHYLGFMAMLYQSPHRMLLSRIPPERLEATETFLHNVRGHLTHLPEVVREHRLVRAILFAVVASAERERAHAAGHEILPFELHVSDLLDGIIGFLEAEVSDITMQALADAGDTGGSTRLVG